MSEPRHLTTIDDYEYDAVSFGGAVWMVRRFPLNAPLSEYTEALITVATTEPLDAIKAAIDRNSWA